MVFVPVMVAGVLVTPTDSGSTDEIMKAVGFNHPEKYSQINDGRGSGQIQSSVGAWQQGIGSEFDAVASLLDEANAKAGVAWEGKAAEAHGGSMKPMSQFIRDSKEISVAVGDSAGNMATAFGDVKNSMPEPPKVDATDSMLEKGGAWLTSSETDLQQQEREANEKAQEAKRTYETYDSTIQDAGKNLPAYPAAPNMTYDQGAGQPQQNQQINSPSNPGGGGSTQSGGTSTGGVGGSGSGSGGGFSGGGSGGSSNVPAGTDSSWAQSPATGGPGMGGNPGANPGANPGGGPGGVGAGIIGGAGPGGAGGRGAGGAGGGGRGAGGGAGAGGRAGAGAGGAGQLGAGGRAGAGGVGGTGPGAGGAGAAGGAAGGARGGAGAGGMGGAGRGQGGEEEEHERPSWLEEQDDIWMNDMPKTAPAVFGDWDADNR